MAILIALVVVVLLILGIAYIGRQARQEERAPVEELDRRDINPEQSLLEMCRGDEGRFERLIAQEQELRPKISRKQAVKNALYRLRNLH